MFVFGEKWLQNIFYECAINGTGRVSEMDILLGKVCFNPETLLN